MPGRPSGRGLPVSGFTSATYPRTGQGCTVTKMIAQRPQRRRRFALVILNVACALVIVGALYDLLVPGVPPNHLKFVGSPDPRFNQRFAQLDLAMLRSIGGCLLAIGVTSLALVNGPVRRGDGWARVAVLFLIGGAEANNSYRMYPFGSPWYGPLAFAALAVAGVVLIGGTNRGSRELALEARLDKSP